MKKALIISMLIILSTTLFTSCSKENLQDKSIRTNSEIVIKKEETTSPVVKEEKYYAPYTGEEISKETSNNIPFMVIIENSKDARPHSGISEADIIYEAMAEGGIPRFMAIFHKNSPETIGPVRSARPYFVELSKEYNLPFGHCGGSEEALTSIKNEGLMSMDEIPNGVYYFRDNSRKAPHNLYTSAQKLRSLITTKNYTKTPSFNTKFNNEYWNTSSFNIANNITLNFNKYYTVAYNYNNGAYTKTMDGVQTIDKATNDPVSVSNIVVQFADVSQRDDGHLDIALTGKGNGYIISSGKYTKINWSKEKVDSKTILTNEAGEEIPLAPGKTWWHIADKNLNIQFN